MKTYTNKYFVYEGEILRAAQPTFNSAIRFFKDGYKILQGTPDNHKTDVTKIVIKLKSWNYANN